MQLKGLVQLNGVQVAGIPNGGLTDTNGDLMLGKDLFKNGNNTVKYTTWMMGGSGSDHSVRMSQGIRIGFKNNCVIPICKDEWKESCVERGFLDPDDIHDIVDPADAPSGSSNGGGFNNGGGNGSVQIQQ